MNDVINGKRYGLWPQFVDKKDQYIGGVLESHEDGETYTTQITDIRFEPNGDTSAALHIDGKEFGVGADVHNLAIDPMKGGNGWIAMSGYGGHWWRIKQKTAPTPDRHNDKTLPH